jgi:hypothetical protein
MQAVALARNMRDAIKAVRGRTYTVMQELSLYPTAGSVNDYAYGRHMVDSARTKVYSYTIEWARKVISTVQTKRPDARTQCVGPSHLYYCRQRPTLPYSFPYSTIGGSRLNFRVRNGNGCDPAPMTTGIVDENSEISE